MLDEPTTGLDPQARHVLWDRLFRLKERGTTLVLTTHYMDEAEQLCDRLVVVDKGRIMAEGSPAQLIREYSTREVVELRFGSDQQRVAAERMAADRPDGVLPDRVLLYAEDGEAVLERVHAAGAAAHDEPRAPVEPRGRVPSPHGTEPDRMTVEQEQGQEQDMATRARRFGAWYMAEHQFRAMRAYGWTILMTGTGSPVLYLLGIGLGLATFLDQPIADGANGPVSYLLFVAPALLATSAVTVATGEFTYVVMAGFQLAPIFWGMNASPVEPGQIASGLVLAVFIRMILTTTVYYLIMVAFGAVGDPWGAAWMPLVGVLGGMAFGLPLMTYSATLTQDKGQFALVSRFVFTPMFLFSGTFFPLATLPVWLQWIGWVSPLWHASEIGRSMSYGSPPGSWPVGWHYAVLVAYAVLGWVLAHRVFRRRLR